MDSPTNDRGSRQIRPPIYSLKQSRLRKRRVIRYAILYFIMLIVFLVLFVGPVIARHYIHGLSSIPYNLLQPTGQDNNDTLSFQTGSALIGGGGSSSNPTSAAAAPAATSDFFSFPTAVKLMPRNF